MPWHLYLLECTGGGIYVGIARDVDARFAEHAAGKGALYTRLFPPLRLIGVKTFSDHRSAAQEERVFKKLTPLQKRQWAFALSGAREFPEGAGCVGVEDVHQDA
ncbi:GIY-YIG nuclease family protein [Thiomonas sp.]